MIFSKLDSYHREQFNPRLFIKYLNTYKIRYTSIISNILFVLKRADVMFSEKDISRYLIADGNVNGKYELNERPNVKISLLFTDQFYNRIDDIEALEQLRSDLRILTQLVEQKTNTANYFDFTINSISKEELEKRPIYYDLKLDKAFYSEIKEKPPEKIFIKEKTPEPSEPLDDEKTVTEKKQEESESDFFDNLRSGVKGLGKALGQGFKAVNENSQKVIDYVFGKPKEDKKDSN